MNINELVDNYMFEGYEIGDAQSKVCQDIILLKIGKSKYNRNVTIKGGVVMHTISNDLRRATQDLDLDFIKYSLEDESIRNFVSELNRVNDEIKITINNPIEKLHHQDYDGKRVHITLKDSLGTTIDTKLDIGVHKDFNIIQDEYFFDFNILGDSVSLLINSNEQIIVEKLKSLLKFGIRTTRYKDVFDFYYLVNNKKINKDILINYIDKLIIEDDSIPQHTLSDILERLKIILNNNRFKIRLNTARSNWLELPVDEVIGNVLNFFNSLEKVTI